MRTCRTHFTKLKTLLDKVNVEDRGCTERVYRGLCSNGRARAPVTSGAAQLRFRAVSEPDDLRIEALIRLLRAPSPILRTGEGNNADASSFPFSRRQSRWEKVPEGRMRALIATVSLRAAHSVHRTQDCVGRPAVVFRRDGRCRPGTAARAVRAAGASGSAGIPALYGVVNFFGKVPHAAR